MQEASGRRRRGRPRWMVDGVTGVSAVKNVVEDGRKEVAQILRLNMEELIVQKDMDLEIKKVATKKNALVSTKDTLKFFFILLINKD